MITLTILVPVIVALTEAIKRAEVLNKKFMPFVAIVLGIGFTMITMHAGEVWTDALILGITAGLTSVGLFSGVKNVLKK